jgi:outer membrane protein assembly factor BamB
MTLFSEVIGKFKTKKEGRVVKEWDFLADDIITTSPAVSRDNSLIVFGTKNGKIYALDPDGKMKWVYAIKKEFGKEELFFLEEEKFKQVSAEPVIADLNNDGKAEVIISSEIGALFVLNINGNLLWSFSAEDAIKTSALVADINNDKKLEVIFGSNDTFVYALNSKGQILWKFKAKSSIESTPTIIKAKQNQIIFGSNDGTIYSIDKKGKLLWEFKTNDKITAQPAIGKLDGENFHIVIGSLDNNLYALDDKGRLIWKYPTDGKIFSKAIISDINKDRKPEILFGSCDDKLHVISNKGNKIWDYETNFWVVTPPLVSDIDSDNKLEIVIGSYDNFVYILDTEGKYILDYMPGISSITQQSGHYFDVITKEPGSFYGELLWKYKASGMVTGSAIIKNNNSILITTNTKKIDKLIYKKD